MNRKIDRGAAALEMALVLPILVALFMGIAEFGRAWYIHAALAGAAREGAREVSINHDVGAATQAAVDGAPGMGVTAAMVDVSSACTTPGDAVVTITYPLTLMTGFFGESFTLTGIGTMRCGG